MVNCRSVWIRMPTEGEQPCDKSCRLPVQVLTARDITICKDAAYILTMQMPAHEQTRGTYESFTHLNNVELVGNLVITKGRAIKAGEELLLTKGWDFYTG